MKKLIFLILGLCGFQQAFAQPPSSYSVDAGNGNGFRLWNSDEYKIHMGNTSEYNFGPVNGYSVKSNMYNSGGWGWTWGTNAQTPVAALSAQGHMQIAGSLSIGPVFATPWLGRLSISGSAGEVSITNRSISSYVNSPTQGERWSLYSDGAANDGKLKIWSGSDIMTFSKEGRVGVGTTGALIAKLQVKVPVSTTSACGVLSSYEGFLVGDDISSTLLMRSLGSGVMHISTDCNGRRLVLGGGGFEQTLFINSGGLVGIGTSSPDQKLTVNGIIHAKEVKVDLSVPGPDYVFENSYALRSLVEVKSYIDANKHLPEIPAATEMEKNGINVSELNMLLLKKVEELTLYIIDQEKRIVALENENRK